jgi:hypothetical protein
VNSSLSNNNGYIFERTGEREKMNLLGDWKKCEMPEVRDA